MVSNCCSSYYLVSSLHLPYGLGRDEGRKPCVLRNHCFKPTIKNASQWFATAHGDKDCTFWRNILWSDKIKIELFGHNDHCSVWRDKWEACKPKNTEARGLAASWVGGCFAAGGTGALHKIDDIMRMDNYVDILKQHLKTSVRKFKLGRKSVFRNGQ